MTYRFRFTDSPFAGADVEANTLKQARRRFARLCGFRRWEDLPDPETVVVTTGPTAEVPCRDTH